MAIKISKKTKVILLSVLGVLFLSGTGFLIWRITQEETVAPEESEADQGCYTPDELGGDYCGPNGNDPCTAECYCTYYPPDGGGQWWKEADPSRCGIIKDGCGDGNCDPDEDASSCPQDCTGGRECICGKGNDQYCSWCSSWDDCESEFGSCGCTGWGDPHPCVCGDGYCYIEHEGPNSANYCPEDCGPEETPCTSCACSNLGSGWSTSPCDASNPNCQSQWSTCTPSGCSQTDTVKPVMCYKDTTTYCTACSSCSSLGTGWTTTPCSGAGCLTEQTTCTPAGCTPTSTIKPINCYKQTDVVEYCTSCGNCSSLGSWWSTTPCSGVGCSTEQTTCTPAGCTPTSTIRPVTCYKQSRIVEYCTSCQDCSDLGTGWSEYCPTSEDCIEDQTTCYPSGCTPMGALGPKTCYKVVTVNTCGNGVCDGDDTLQNCPQDCWKCGDKTCTTPYENATSCPQDCTQCGDGLCTNGETANSCPQDCGSHCPDGYCTHDENPSTCPLDCSAVCPDGYCTHSETALSCPADCDSVCGDGSCTHDETAVSCPADCDPDCGDGACTGDESALTCPKDCDAKCGDGDCTHSENANTCPEDCHAICGDGYCTGNETASSCPSDCDATCGDGSCTHDETVNSCPEDCEASCGDGYCTGDENQTNCPVDCGTASGPTPQTGIFDTVLSRIIAGMFLIIIGINWGSITRTVTKLNYTTKEKLMDRKLEKFERKVSKKK